MPNQRRRKLSTAMSAAAALAVASPFGIVALSDLSAGSTSGPQHQDFVAAAVVTDLPGELMSALSQGLSQFGVNLPPVPTGLSPAGAMPSASPGLMSPGLMSPGLTSPGLTSPGLTSPGLTSPGLTGVTGVTAPGTTTPALTDPALANPALTNPALSSPTSPLLGTSPTAPGLGLTDPSEMPIGAPIGLDPGMGDTYPILGDPSLAAAPTTGGGGLVSDLMSAANQLGAGQLMDLLKGAMMPAIAQAAQGAAAAPAAAAAAPVV